MNIFWNSRKTLGILVILACIAFADVLFGGKTFYYRDFGVLGIPTTFYARHSFWNGEIPLWNPYSNCGAPFLAQWGTMCLYPLSLIYLLLPFPWSLNFFCVVHLVIGGYGAFKLARAWSGHDFGSTLAAVIFTFNGLTLACLAWPNYCVAIGWMPWVLLYVPRAAKEGERETLKAIVVASMQLLAGVPELVLLTWGAAFVITIAGSRSKDDVRWFFVRGFLVVAAVAALCAAQLLPFLELWMNSQRASGIAEAKWSLPMPGVLDLVMPFFRVFKTPQGTYFQYGQHFLSSIYLGALAIALGSAGLVLARDRATKAWFAVAIVGVVIAVEMPLSSMARYPVKALLILPCVISVGAAIGFRELSIRPERLAVWIRIAGVGFIVLTLGGVAWMRLQPLPYDRWHETIINSTWRACYLFAGLAALWAVFKDNSARTNRLAQCGLIALVFLDFRTVIPNQNPTMPSEFFVPGLAQQRGLKLPSLGEGRIFITPKAENELLMTSVPDAKAEMIGKRSAEWSHLNLLDLVPKVNGSSTLQLREQAVVQTNLYATNDPGALLDFLGVTAQTSADDIFTWDSRKTAAPLINAGSATAISNIVFTAHRISFSATTTEELTKISIAQAYDQNWVVRISGQRGKLLRANDAFQAVPVPAGTHFIELIYQPWTFRVGGVISISTLIVMGIAAFRLRAT